jgi:hypothetical protein
VVLHPEANLAEPFGTAGDLRVADMNGDGYDDVVTAGVHLEIFLGDERGGFTRSYQSSDGGFGAVAPPADFNGDGALDVAWAWNGSLRMRTGDGAGRLSSDVWTPPDPGPHVGPDNAVSLTATDFNRDGRDDLAVAYAGTGGGGGVRVFLGRTDGSFGDSLRYFFPNATRGFVIDWADTDDDGIPDLVVGTDDHGVMVARGQGPGGIPNGTFADPAGTDAGRVQALVTDDFDGDGAVDDVVYARDPGTSVFLRRGASGGLGPEVSAGTISGVGFYVAQLVAADVDDDGTLDVAGSSFGDFVRVLFGNGTGFEEPQSFPIRPYGTATALAVGDFPRDGVDDLVVGDEHQSVSYVMRNSPYTLFDTDTLDFGDVRVGAVSAPQAVEIANAGVAPLSIQDVTAEGDGFSLASNSCPRRLAFAQAARHRRGSRQPSPAISKVRCCSQATIRTGCSASTCSDAASRRRSLRRSHHLCRRLRYRPDGPCGPRSSCRRPRRPRRRHWDGRSASWVWPVSAWSDR